MKTDRLQLRIFRYGFALTVAILMILTSLLAGGCVPDQTPNASAPAASLPASHDAETVAASLTAGVVPTASGVYTNTATLPNQSPADQDAAPNTGAASAQPLPADLSTQEAQQIAQEAFIYAYPMLENYKTALVTLDPASIKFWAPINQWYHRSNLSGPAYTTVVLSNNDTLYSRAWLDLRAEPIVLSVPEEPKQRWYTVQVVDLYTHNIGNVGTRQTGNAASHYLIAGPSWNRPKPAGIDGVIQSETNFVVLFGRHTVYGPDDVSNARALQLQMKFTPLSTFLDQPAPPPAPKLDYPTDSIIYWLAARWYDSIGPGRPDASDALGRPQRELSPANFIVFLNFMLGQVQPYPWEQDTLARFARIGIGPNRPFNAQALPPAIRMAIETGVVAGYNQIRDYFPQLADETANGWNLHWTLFGTPEQMRGKYLRRAAAAMYGIYALSVEEAFYPFSNTDVAGQPADASKQSYVIKFRKEDLPPVDGFWSLTMYLWPQEWLAANSIERYSIGDRTPGLKYGDDGSLTIYVSYQSPGKDKESNWLPAPNGTFFLLWRLYGPKQQVLDRQWVPPPMTALSATSTEK